MSIHKGFNCFFTKFKYKFVIVCSFVDYYKGFTLSDSAHSVVINTFITCFDILTNSCMFEGMYVHLNILSTAHTLLEYFLKGFTGN